MYQNFFLPHFLPHLLRKTAAVILSGALVFSPILPDTQTKLDISSHSCLLMEASTGVVLYEDNADEKLRPASITKIMTLLLIFDAISEGKISLTDVVSVSEHAAGMGGSQVYLEPGEKQTVETMIKCICVASANDASVAMAEYVSGSEEQFVDLMNDKAKELGMINTNFVNCCGLDADGHYSTARDVALMSRELITKHPEIHNYSTIWMDTIIHSTRRGDSEFGLSNTNKLLKQYEWATGLKTGYTSGSGFCLSSTASKDGIDLIAVVMNAPDSKLRSKDCIKLLNYGFGIVKKYEDTDVPAPAPIRVHGGVNNYINCAYREIFSCVFLNEYDASKITSHTEYPDKLSAPIAKGDTIGMLVYEYDGNRLGYVDIIATEDCPKAHYGDYISKFLREFFN